MCRGTAGEKNREHFGRQPSLMCFASHLLLLRSVPHLEQTGKEYTSYNSKLATQTGYIQQVELQVH